MQISCLFYTKKATFSILHTYFYKTHTSFYLFYTFIKYNIHFFYNFLLFSLSPPLSLTDPSLPTIPPHPATIITTQPASSRKTNPLNSRPSQSQIHSIPNPFITHPTWNPIKPNHHPPNLKSIDDLIGLVWWLERPSFDDLMIWSAWFDDRWLAWLDDWWLVWLDDLSVTSKRWSAAMEDDLIKWWKGEWSEMIETRDNGRINY